MRKLLLLALTLFAVLFTTIAVKAQYVSAVDTAFKNASPGSGRIWGYTFGDYAYKGHNDPGYRGGSNQYTGLPEGRNTFQFRRIYLGYDYNISNKFSAELLLAAEDNFPAGNPPSSAAASGDELLNNKLSFYIKLMNIRVKGLWKGTDLVIGQLATPAFPAMSERIWNYRSIERTVSDIRRTPSYDLGVALQGVFDPATRNFGYDLMMGNGSSAKPESDNFKWFYGDIYGYFAQKKIVIDLYADYERLAWTPVLHHSRQMLKGFIAYNSAANAKTMDPGNGYTIGVEAYVNNLNQDVTATKIGGGTDLLDNKASGISIFFHGDIVPKKLRFFLRYDATTPTNQVNTTLYTKYSLGTGNYNDNTYTLSGSTFTAAGDQTYKQQFLVGGLDFTPAKGVHFMPNVWINTYKSQLATPPTGDNSDVVYRLTFYYVFGK